MPDAATLAVLSLALASFAVGFALGEVSVQRGRMHGFSVYRLMHRRIRKQRSHLRHLQRAHDGWVRVVTAYGREKDERTAMIERLRAALSAAEVRLSKLSCCVPGGAGAYEYRDGAFRCTTCGRVEEVVD